MRSLRRILPVLLITGLTASSASAYYHYLHYTTRGAPFGTAPEKFDLTALPNKTVTFFVTDSGPLVLPRNDSFASVLSQIRQAAATWNAVGTSDLRVTFGGLFNANSLPAASAGASVDFIELPPGFLGFGGPGTSLNSVTTVNGTFYPIAHSAMHLTTDLTQKPGPSYSDQFFLTAVHEMGHALGLQHTFTSSAMSTNITRATSLTRPIDADDIAGLSVLYPAASFGTTTGSITGRVVAANGLGVHMASVVAIRNGAGAVSAMTDPDGDFRMDGVPPGQYYVYAHPLPPQATQCSPACNDITPPIDASGAVLIPSGPFNTNFYPGTTDIVQAAAVGVTAGSVTALNPMSVQARADVPVYGVQILSYFNGNYVSPGYLNMTPAGYGGVLAYGTGLTANNAVASGLKVQVMGGGATVYSYPYYADPVTGAQYLNMGVSYALGATPGPQHLIFSEGGFIYVLPSGLDLVRNSPPSVSSVSGNPDGSVSITGTGFAPDSAVYFDGLPTAVRSLNDTAGQAVVVPPPGASGQNATVSVYNHDGQNSLFLQAGSPPTYSFGAAAPPSIAISPNALPAGSLAAITITGVNTKFTVGQMVIGFGSSDVFVQDVFVLSPTQVLVNVSIPAKAALTTTEVTAISGFQIASLPNGFTIQPPGTAAPAVNPQLQNAVPGQTGAYPGALVTLSGSDLTSGVTAATVTIGSQPANIVNASPTQITLQVPAALPPGPAILQVNNGLVSGPPVAVGIDSPPAVISVIRDVSGNGITGSNPARGGNVVDLLMSGFSNGASVIFPSEVTVLTGNVSQTAVQVVPAGSGLVQVRFVLSSLTPSGPQIPITVYLDGMSSLPAAINVANQ